MDPSAERETAPRHGGHEAVSLLIYRRAGYSDQLSGISQPDSACGTITAHHLPLVTVFLPFHPVLTRFTRIGIHTQDSANRSGCSADSAADDPADRSGRPIAIFNTAFSTANRTLSIGCASQNKRGRRKRGNEKNALHQLISSDVERAVNRPVPTAFWWTND